MTTLSYKDNVNKFTDYIKNNCLIQTIFGNAFFISIIITCLLIIIININIDNKTSQILYSFMTTFAIVLLFNYSIKFQYTNKVKQGGELSFIGMMEENSKDGKIQIIKKLNNTNFRNDTITAEKDVENFLNNKNF